MSNETLYYCGHSAWAVKTRGHYLLFDFQDNNVKAGGLLTDGFVDLNILKSSADEINTTGEIDSNSPIDRQVSIPVPVIIFYSHRHFDHYSRKLYKESAGLSYVHTVFGDFDPAINGLKASDSASATVMRPKEKAVIDGVTLYTAASTDEGVCYLVEADGLNVFFSGDNADWGDGDPANRLYYQEIDYIAGLGIAIDIAFIPVCTFSGQRPPDMTKGALYAIDKLNPGIACPMHANGREPLYEAFEKDLRKTGSTTRVICARHPGEAIKI